MVVVLVGGVGGYPRDPDGDKHHYGGGDVHYRLKGVGKEGYRARYEEGEELQPKYTEAPDDG